MGNTRDLVSKTRPYHCACWMSTTLHHQILLALEVSRSRSQVYSSQSLLGHIANSHRHFYEDCRSKEQCCCGGCQTVFKTLSVSPESLVRDASGLTRSVCGEGVVQVSLDICSLQLDGGHVVLKHCCPSRRSGAGSVFLEGLIVTSVPERKDCFRRLGTVSYADLNDREYSRKRIEEPSTTNHHTRLICRSASESEGN